jgi:hypothetical protein
MLTRILTVALAVGTLAIGAAFAQTGSTTSPGTTSPSTTSPGTTSPSTGSSGSTMGGGSGMPQQAQGAFDVTKYKTKAECLTAARSAKADATLCDAVRTR